MKTTVKLMLASTPTREEIEGHLKDAGVLYCSEKIDGVRGCVLNGRLMSRSMKEIRNIAVQARFGRSSLAGADGELVLGDPMAPDCYRKTNSAVMSIEGDLPVEFHVFDRFDVSGDFTERLKHLPKAGKGVVPVEQHAVHSMVELDALAERVLSVGGEGLIIRRGDRPYKNARATSRCGSLMKLKPFEDAEATVVGVEELMRNENESFTNELGRTARSTAKAGLVPGGVLGALVCMTAEGVEFRVGTGFDMGERVQLWRSREKLIGRLAKFRYLAVGIKTAPRHPSFAGWRDASDL